MLPGQGIIRKKLIDAARHWAAQGRSASRNDDQRDRAAGPPEWQQAIAEWEAQHGAQEAEEYECTVWPENEQAVRVFIALRRCWRIDSMAGQVLGIERPAIESTLRLMSIKKKRRQQIFDQIMIMENAAIPVLNRK